MAIKLNGVEITSNKLNGSNVSEEKLNGVKVFPTMADIWKQTSNTNYTKELDLYSDPYGDNNYNPNYQGCALPSYLLSQLNSRRPATSEAVGTIIRVRENLDLGSLGGEVQWCSTYMYYEATLNLQWQFVMSYSSEPDYYDFRTEQYIYGDYEQGLNWLHLNFQEDLNEGFVAVISDKSTLYNFEYVVVLV